jgi:hypothetical protein
MSIVIGITIIALPFAAILLLLRRAKRNRDDTHGGGIDRYRQIRSGRSLR